MHLHKVWIGLLVGGLWLSGGPALAQEGAYPLAVEEASDLLDAGQFAKALEKAQQAASLDGSRVDAHFLMAVALYKLGRLDQAERAALKAEEVSPAERKPALRTVLQAIQEKRQFLDKVHAAERHAKQDHHEPAAQAYLEGWRFFPMRDDVAFKAVSAFVAAGRADRALEVLSELQVGSTDQTVIDRSRSMVKDLRKQLDDQYLQKAQARMSTAADWENGLSLGDVSAGLSQVVREEKARGSKVLSLAFDRSGAWTLVTTSKWWSGGASSLTKTMKEASEAGEGLHSVAIAPNGGWVVVTRKRTYWEKVPPWLAAELGESGAEHDGLRQVYCAPNGDWLLFSQAKIRAGGPDSLQKKLGAARSAGEQLRYVSVSPTGGWLLVTDRAWYWEGLPSELADKVEKASREASSVPCLGFEPDGGWVFVPDSLYLESTEESQ